MHNTPTAKRNWEELIANSNGQMMRFPAASIEAVKKWYADRVEFQKMVAELARHEHLLNHQIEGILFKIREYLGENKIEGAWSADIGVNMDAIKDGEYILNVTHNVQK